MVRNEDIKQEFELFANVWKTYKVLLPVGSRADTKYWDGATNIISKIMQKYPGQLSKDLALAILSDLERRCEENEDQDAGRTAIS